MEGVRILAWQQMESHIFKIKLFLKSWELSIVMSHAWFQMENHFIIFFIQFTISKWMKHIAGIHHLPIE